MIIIRRKKNNLLYLITTFDVGGVENVVARTVRKLNRAKYDITVAALKMGSGKLIDELKSAEVQIVNIDMQFKYDIRRAFRIYDSI